MISSAVQCKHEALVTIIVENICWILVNTLRWDPCISWALSDFIPYKQPLWVLFLFPFCRWGKGNVEVTQLASGKILALILGYLKANNPCSELICWIQWPIEWCEFWTWQFNHLFPPSISVYFIPGLFTSFLNTYAWILQAWMLFSLSSLMPSLLPP